MISKLNVSPIMSKDNPLIKQFLALTDTKGRLKNGLYLIEGIKLIREALAFGEDVKNIIIAESKKEEYLPLLSKDIEGVIIRIVADSIMSKLSDTVSPQGVVASIAFSRKSFELPRANFLILDRIRDPKNLATIIRTAAAAEYHDIYLIDCVDEYSPKVIRGAANGMFFIRTYHIDETHIKSLKNEGTRLIVADMSGKNLFEASLPLGEKYGIIIGNEANGVSKELATLADYEFSIPMKNIESLNAGVAAGIFMYNILMKTKII